MVVLAAEKPFLIFFPVSFTHACRAYCIDCFLPSTIPSCKKSCVLSMLLYLACLLPCLLALRNTISTRKHGMTYENTTRNRIVVPKNGGLGFYATQMPHKIMNQKTKNFERKNKTKQNKTKTKRQSPGGNLWVQHLSQDFDFFVFFDFLRVF